MMRSQWRDLRAPIVLSRLPLVKYYSLIRKGAEELLLSEENLNRIMFLHKKVPRTSTAAMESFR